MALENLALRQQLAAFETRGRPPRIRAADRAFWVILRRLRNRWTDALVIVKPETVVRWHRAGLELYRKRLSRRGGRTGRPPAEADVRDLIREMATENGWGAPRIHGEWAMLGFEVSERGAPHVVPGALAERANRRTQPRGLRMRLWRRTGGSPRGGRVDHGRLDCGLTRWRDAGPWPSSLEDFDVSSGRMLSGSRLSTCNLNRPDLAVIP